jgi:hypothetical protein
MHHKISMHIITLYEQKESKTNNRKWPICHKPKALRGTDSQGTGRQIMLGYQKIRQFWTYILFA